MKREYEISIIRIVSTLLIVMTHVLYQVYDNYWSTWLNIGVQIFFFMSGYLMGGDSSKDAKWFFLKTKRIMLDYVVIMFFTIILYFCVAPDLIDRSMIIDLFCGKRVLEGMGHFWFIRAILLCYLHVFFIDFMANKFRNSSYINKILFSILTLGILFNFAIEVDKYWLCVFICGYLIKKLFDFEKIFLILSICTGIPTVFLSILRLKRDDFSIEHISQTTSVWWHVFAGIFLFAIMYYILRKMNLEITPKIKKVLEFTDVYSYDVYMTHPIFLSGILPVLHLTKSILINYIIVFAGIFFSAYVLYLIVRRINEKLDAIL